MYQRVMVAVERCNASVEEWIYRMAQITNEERIDCERQGYRLLAFIFSADWIRLLISSSVKLVSLI